MADCSARVCRCLKLSAFFKANCMFSPLFAGLMLARKHLSRVAGTLEQERCREHQTFPLVSDLLPRHAAVDEGTMRQKLPRELYSCPMALSSPCISFLLPVSLHSVPWNLHVPSASPRCSTICLLCAELLCGPPHISRPHRPTSCSPSTAVRGRGWRKSNWCSNLTGATMAVTLRLCEPLCGRGYGREIVPI